jgi:hypothetical protein
MSWVDCVDKGRVDQRYEKVSVIVLWALPSHLQP